MPYITREDGERFIIPSYRDILSAKKPTLLKKEITLLSTNYGGYITLQKRNAEQFEAAFAPEAGYLLGETVWHYFKRPLDLIYCEAIPNTSEAILVIVKAGSVYLDGSFPVDSIADELVVFRTQQNNFDIYIYGDVPISQLPQEGKVALDASSVKSFTTLTESAFEKLPKVKSFQLQLVDVVLKSYGIGVVPVKQIVTTIAAIVLIWMGFNYLSTHKKALPVVIVGNVNPYQTYLSELTSPDPADEMEAVTQKVAQLFTIPGWTPTTINYSGGMLVSAVTSFGIKTKLLYSWAVNNAAIVQIVQNGISVGLSVNTTNRQPPTSISYIQQIIAELADRLELTTPGNVLSLGNTTVKGKYSEMELAVAFTGQTLTSLNYIAEQFRGLPLVLEKIDITVDNGNMNGTIHLQAIGN